MKRQSFVLLVLTIIVLATVFFMKRPQKMVETSYALPDWHLPIDTSRVIRIGIHRGASSVLLDRTHGMWRYAQGGRTAVDSAMVTRLLAGISEFRLLGLVSSNPRKQDVFEVGEAGTSVTVGTEDGNEISLVVGKMSSLPARSYVRPTVSDAVFLATGLTPDVVRGEIGTVLHIDSQPVKRFSKPVQSIAAAGRDMVPRQAALEPPPAVQKAVPENTIEASPSPDSAEEDVLSVHKVKVGETLDSIAQLYNVSRDQIKQWNFLTTDFVAPGSELFVFVKK